MTQLFVPATADRPGISTPFNTSFSKDSKGLFKKNSCAKQDTRPHIPNLYFGYWPCFGPLCPALKLPFILTLHVMHAAFLAATLNADL